MRIDNVSLRKITKWNVAKFLWRTSLPLETNNQADVYYGYSFVCVFKVSIDWCSAVDVVYIA